MVAETPSSSSSDSALGWCCMLATRSTKCSQRLGSLRDKTAIFGASQGRHAEGGEPHTQPPRPANWRAAQHSLVPWRLLFSTPLAYTHTTTHTTRGRC